MIIIWIEMNRLNNMVLALGTVDHIPPAHVDLPNSNECCVLDIVEVSTTVGSSYRSRMQGK